MIITVISSESLIGIIIRKPQLFVLMGKVTVKFYVSDGD